MYFIAFPGDPWGIQVLVYGVYIAEVIQTILLSQSCFRTFATGFGDINAVIAEGNLWFSVPIMSSCSKSKSNLESVIRILLFAVAAVVQAFYAYRISILARSYILPGIILFVSFFSGRSASSLTILPCSFRSYSSEAVWRLELLPISLSCLRTSSD